MQQKWKGAICGVVGSVCYGTNPLGALFLYKENVPTLSVLMYRFGFAAIMLFLVMLANRKSFKVSKLELKVLSVLGILFGISSYSLYSSFKFMDAGLASTLLFVYPIMTAVLMAVFFKERITKITVASILLAFVGILLLYNGGPNASISLAGSLLVALSALSYAIYIVIVNAAQMKMGALKLTFFVLCFCELFFVVASLVTGDLPMLPPTPTAWFWAMMLASVPTVFSLILTTKAIQWVGSTPAAIMGALEPLTAVLIGIFVFGEFFSIRYAFAIVCILSAVLIIVTNKKRG